jgi:hypothetical protein
LSIRCLQRLNGSSENATDSGDGKRQVEGTAAKIVGTKFAYLRYCRQTAGTSSLVFPVGFFAFDRQLATRPLREGNSA